MVSYWTSIKIPQQSETDQVPSSNPLTAEVDIAEFEGPLRPKMQQ